MIIENLADGLEELSSDYEVKDKEHNLQILESGQADICKSLSSAKLRENGIHIGFAGFFNLDIMANAKSSGGILCDVNSNQQPMWNKVFDVIRKIDADIESGKITEENGRTETISKLGHELKFDKFQLKELDDCIKDASSWLGTDENFSHIRKLVANNAIGAITLDITDDKSGFEKLSNFIKDKDAVVDTIYTSNIGYFFEREAKGFYYRGLENPKHRMWENLEKLADERTLAINSDIKKKDKYHNTMASFSRKKNFAFSHKEETTRYR